MACEHLIAFEGGNGTHFCHDGGVALAVLERGRELTDYQRAVDYVLTAAESYVTSRRGGTDENGLAYLNLMEARQRGELSHHRLPRGRSRNLSN